jgi:hypothetical protein
MASTGEHMTIGAKTRAAALPLGAATLVAAVLGVQLAFGGGNFTPTPSANPCDQRDVTSVSTGIEGLGERLVLLGLDGAACRLGTTREALALRLVESKQPPSEAEVNAVRTGLLAAVDHMKADGTLPPASALADEAVDDSSLNPIVKLAIRALPSSVVDSAVQTEDVLKRTINQLNISTLLTNLDNPDELTHQVDAAVTAAVEQELLARLGDLL